MSRQFQQPTHECDLVMKGGITSGVVYPPAVLALAPRYRFRSIGGTSAGAIAAAATAAAEYGRERDGFAKLQTFADQLSADGFLFNLFQPTPQTRPLAHAAFELAQAWKQPGAAKSLRVARRATNTLIRNTPRAFAGGAVLGAGLMSAFVIGMGGSVRGWKAGVPLGAGWLGGVAGSAYALGHMLLRDVPKQHFFGVCTGHGDDAGGAAVLTDWLSASINQLAGRTPNDTPLTFADLAAKRIGEQDCSIALRMVTTNISQHRPYMLPLEANTFVFNAHDMRRLFPDTVVAYLIKHAHTNDQVVLPPNYYFLPLGNALPVVVAMRMSLSFPLLISAVPLYTIKRTVGETHNNDTTLTLTTDDLQINWFSDGGICSNFPIHVFDAWLPSRPTFGINLTAMPPEAFAEHNTAIQGQYQSLVNVDRYTAQRGTSNGNGTKAVYLPKPGEPMAVEWHKIDGLISFAQAIFGSAQNYRDTMQSMLPSYRERIVQVRFAPNEGGLNLAMSADTIKQIQNKGREAALELTERFNFEHHQWVRFLVLFALIERQLEAMDQSLGKVDFQHLLDQQLAAHNGSDPTKRFPYPQTADWSQQASARLHALRTLVQQWRTHTYLVPEPPLPQPMLRVTPQL